MTTADQATPGNRLHGEASPYLRQHAHNPVDWYPWGPEAHERAIAEDKPILLSIGYSACHWCHVMERESFDDPDVAAVMNERFVNVKVDREERPDLDQIYQLVVQMLGRNGGWPLTVFLLPNREPFFGGTYFPPAPRFGMPSFRQVLDAVQDAWTERREELGRTATEIREEIAKITVDKVGAAGMSGDREGTTELPPDLLPQAAAQLLRRLDPERGGFGAAPKFPNTMSLDVLLRASSMAGPEASGDESQAGAFREGVRQALRGMRNGGLYDQLGGGFHRYSVDAAWAVPHFEKMLYDNALLARLYLDAWRLEGDPDDAATVRGTLAYLDREMRAPSGGFYATQDADSEGEEGRFFVWTPEQLREALGDDEDDAELAALWFGVHAEGNFEGGASVLSRGQTLRSLEARFPGTASDLGDRVEELRGRLFDAREERPKPFRDDKVLATWNGLAIGALAEAAGAFDDGELAREAVRALADVRERLFDPETDRLARYALGERVVGRGFLEDYADLAGAALDVYEATFAPDALDFGRRLVDAALEVFWDPEGGGFFHAPAGSDDLIVRGKDPFDQAVPSGTASICTALLRLHGLTDEARYLDRAETTLRGLGPRVLRIPSAFGALLGAMDRYLSGPTQVVLVGAADDPALAELAAVARRRYLPNRVLLRLDPEAPAGTPGAALLEGRRQEEGRATAYVCRNRSCSLPVTDPTSLAGLLDASPAALATD